MRRLPRRAMRSGLALGLAACGTRGPAPDPPATSAPLAPTPNAAREIASTALALDVAALAGTAAITFAGSPAPGATLEIGDLAIERVTMGGAELAHAAADGTLALALPPGDAPATVEIRYRWRHHPFQGSDPLGFTYVWPSFCANLFPCHAAPSDGTTFTLALAGVPAGKTAVFPASIPVEAPAYQLAWAIDDYVELALGATTAGTRLSMWHHPGDEVRARQGGVHLVAAFDWLERTIGPYRFGPKAGGVAVRWGARGGGIEHHPYWHVAAGALAEAALHVHEAAHGWFGGGVRLRCWEDLVLSEGTATYLTARVLDALAPATGARMWAGHEQGLATLDGATPVWPEGCGAVEMLEDGLPAGALYVRGALFYRAVALRVGAEALDRALAAFYAAHATRAATMADMLVAIRDVTGYDPTACAERWLRSRARPALGPCS
jgi:aminopeptidase N